MQKRTLYDSDVEIFDIAAVASALWRRRYGLLFTLVAGGILGVLFALSMPDKYQSNARIEIEDAPISPSSNPLLALAGGRNSAATQVAIIDSNSTKFAAIEKSDFLNRVYSTRTQQLQNRYNRFRTVSSDRLSELNVTNPPVIAKTLNVPQNWEDEAVAVSILTETRFVLNLPDGRTVEGQFGVPLTVDGQHNFTLERVSGQPGDKYSIMKYSLQQAMEHFTNNLSVEEIGKTGLISLSFVANSTDEALVSLEALLAEFISADTRHAVKTAQTRLDYIENEIPTAIQQIEIAENALNKFQKDAQTVNLEFETESLLRQVSQIELLLREDQIPKEKERLQGIRDELFSRLSTIPDSQQHIQNLTRDIEIAQTIYLELMKRVQELRVARASAHGTVRVIDQPYVYAKPIGPKRLQLAVLASLIVTMLHVLIIIIGNLAPRQQSYNQ